MSDDFPERLDADPRPAPPPPRRRRPSAGVIAAGIALACLLGLVGGYAMKPVLNDAPVGSRPHRTVELPHEPQGIGIEAASVPPPPAPQAAEPEETQAPVEESGPQSEPAHPEASDDAEPAPPQPAPKPKPQPKAEPAPERQAPRPSFNCNFARTLAERMVCDDPRLAALDRRMAAAYRQALDAGVPRHILDRQQAVWMSARDRAARDGPAAVADVYGERIAELQGMARY